MTSAKYKIVVEQHEDGFVAYPLGFAGCVVGQGDNADEAIADVQSAIRFHIDSRLWVSRSSASGSISQ